MSQVFQSYFCIESQSRLTLTNGLRTLITSKPFPPDEKDFADNMFKSEYLHKMYLATTNKNNSRHWKALELSEKMRVQPVHIVNYVWRSHNVWFFKKALMAIVSHWEKLGPDAGLCLMSFSQEDYDTFEQEVECREFVAGILELFKANYRLPPEGTISPERYDDIQSELTRLRTVCYEEAENDDDRLSVKKLWPYQDSKEV
ncbi:uncharacterized protein BP5553_06221 [Venustampulla echinocandica]|uniref:Uncharacterized protein n=1 Tax=Venustampulla echinocandica TaxID=2656787 RepID=A0A370TMX5_9HELO|nr:uncharacterized protein BP5553_06221 [Venustampulla echinocandica]RDL36869.1 hypothetical protein BP5553_06221 [Venustampulla echinocandica]